MPTISRFYGIEIRMFFDEKHGPHFHAVYGEYAASISALNGDLLGGHLPPRALKYTEEWRKLHRQELLDNWERARNRARLEQIEGLK